MPRQARSLTTIDAIFEATIQVLLTHGAVRLTTTRVAPELDGPDLVNRIGARMLTSVTAMLASAADADFDDLPTITFMLLTAMAGPTRSLRESDAVSPDMLTALREQMVLLCCAYMARLARTEED